MLLIPGSRSKRLGIGRNEPCPCGSGKKYKTCCLNAPASAVAFLAQLNPGELINARRQAFMTRDFGFIFDTYHPDSNFRQQFSSRNEYIDFGRSSLAQDFSITDYRIMADKITGRGDQAQILLFMEVINRGVRSAIFESILLLKTSAGWRYHSAQKLDRQDFSGPVENITWADFERVAQKVFF